MSDFGFAEAGPAAGGMVEENLSAGSESLDIAVTEPTKRGEGMEGHVVYRVSTKVWLSWSIDAGGSHSCFGLDFYASVPIPRVLLLPPL